jgi:hypothetical protein
MQNIKIQLALKIIAGKENHVSHINSSTLLVPTVGKENK